MQQEISGGFIMAGARDVVFVASPSLLSNFFLPARSYYCLTTQRDCPFFLFFLRPFSFLFG